MNKTTVSAPIVISSKPTETLLRERTVLFDRPIPVKYGIGQNSRQHIAAAAIGVKYEAREYRSSVKGPGYGKMRTSVNCIVLGVPALRDETSKLALFQDADGETLALKGSIKGRTFVNLKGEEVVFSREDDLPLPMTELDGEETPDPIEIMVWKATFGVNYNAREESRASDDQLSLAPGRGVPRRLKTRQNGTTGEIEENGFVVDWDQIPSFEGRVKQALLEFETINDEDLTFIVNSIPYASDSKHAKAEASGSTEKEVEKAIDGSVENPFEATV